MNDKLEALTYAMLDYEAGCPERGQHLLKVHTFSRLIGTGERLDENTLFVLETAALVHDIGIRPALTEYGSSAGPLQEKLGPPIAEKLLRELDFEDSVIERVCWLVGHHHTYTDINAPDYQILVEADFLVNLYENNASADACRSAYRKIFRTGTGKRICRKMYSIED